MGETKRALVTGYWLLATGLCLFTATQIHAATVAIDNWDVDEGWSSDAWLTTDQTADALEVRLPDDALLGEDEWAGKVWTDASALYAGGWVTDMSVGFDFWAQSNSPGYLQVWWAGTNDPNRIWKATVFDTNTSSMTVGATNSYYSPTFRDYDEWGGAVVGNQSEFLADLDAIDWIGVFIWRGLDGVPGETFFIDNFRLIIPEPPEIAMLAAVMAVALVLERRKKKPKASYT